MFWKEESKSYEKRMRAHIKKHERGEYIKKNQARRMDLATKFIFFFDRDTFMYLHFECSMNDEKYIFFKLND